MERGAPSHPDRYNETEVTFPLLSRQRKINFPRYYEILWNAYSRTRSLLVSSLERSKRNVSTEALSCCTDLAALVHAVPIGHPREDQMKQMFSTLLPGSMTPQKAPADTPAVPKVLEPGLYGNLLKDLGTTHE